MVQQTRGPETVLSMEPLVESVARTIADRPLILIDLYIAAVRKERNRADGRKGDYIAAAGLPIRLQTFTLERLVAHPIVLKLNRPTQIAQRFVDETPTARLMRQVLGAIAEFDKTTAACSARLRASRLFLRPRLGYLRGVRNPRCHPGPEAFPTQPLRGRGRTGVMNAPSASFLKPFRFTGRKTLIIAGVWTSVCVMFPALDAKAAGFKMCAVIDASGDPSEIGVADHARPLRPERWIDAMGPDVDHVGEFLARTTCTGG
jgi:hypothetical protein